MRWVRALALAAALPSPVGAQTDLVVQSYMPEGAEARAVELLRAALADVDFVVRRGSSTELGSALRRRPAGDLLLGVDGHYASELGRAGLLEQSRWLESCGIAPPFVDPEHRFAIPLLSPFVIAFDRGVWTEDFAPADFDALLFDPAYAGEIVVGVPESVPGLWVGWMQRLLRSGYEESRALAWLRTLDSRVFSYEPSVSDVLTSLASRRGSIAVLPAADAASSPRLGYHLPRPAAPVQALAMAVVAGRASPLTRRALEYLLSRDFAVGMAVLPLVPTPRSDLAPGVLPDDVQRLSARLMPYDDEQVDLSRMFAAWRDSVQGTAKPYQILELILDGGFTIGFVVFLYFMARGMKKNP